MKLSVSVYLILCVASSIIMVMATVQRARFLLGTNDYYVRVINGFTDNSSVPLVIWCSSEEMDLGGRALQEHDDFSWVMRPSFWSSNRMKCTMKWDSTRKSFEAFKASRDTERCGIHRTCSWMVTQDGFYFSNDEVNWRKDFLW
ncbi:S-protein homolog 5 [Vigna unguiculata]|uniref:S-protein homolog n=1 Tax=Vigna unguiculata TaxID=3917 RepID=A0A4D6KL72_VIGUN|nr:S-protein homolog 5 [Vigna unguiculata]QCD77360.1 Plant self-incompatibility S1 [Vigna unguiculata]